MTKKKKDLDFTKSIKIIDPVIQSLLIVNLFWLFDKKGNVESLLLKAILCTQLLSFFVNLFLHFHKKLRLERYSSFVVILLWFLLDWIVNKKIAHGTLKEIQYEVIVGRGLSVLPVYASSVIIVGILISLWYFFICAREIQYLMKKRRKR